MENQIPLPKLPWNIYWINLDRRQDRKKHMERLLINNIENSVRIQAVDYKNDFYPYNIIKNNKINMGEHGCVSSHIKALYYFLNNSQDDYCFISEDDLSNEYSLFWKEKHYDILKNSNGDILQLQTTENYYDNNKLELVKLDKHCSGATFYRIKRNIAEIIVNKYFCEKTNTINLTLHKHPVADGLIWSYGTVYLLPMFTYLNVEDSETTPDNKNMTTYWSDFFKNAQQKYLNFWKNI